jgi:hypothetical protein
MNRVNWKLQKLPVAAIRIAPLLKWRGGRVVCIGLWIETQAPFA